MLSFWSALFAAGVFVTSYGLISLWRDGERPGNRLP